MKADATLPAVDAAVATDSIALCAVASVVAVVNTAATTAAAASNPASKIVRSLATIKRDKIC